MGKKFYVTTPIYYPTDIPHIGHAYTTLAADVLARWHRFKGEDVWFSTGTDEHGKKLEEAAGKQGKKVKEFIDELIPKFKDAWQKLDIKYDRFIRTTDKVHEENVKRILQKVYDKGDIYLGEYEGLYCTGCEAYYTEKELEEGCCPIHKKKVEVLKEKSYFFKLSRYQQKLLELYKKNPDFILPEHRKNEVVNFVRQGLRDLSISRTTFDWGIPLPFDKEHIAYVWFDALFNYHTAAGKKFEMWPADVHLIGKDILRFHAVYWPAFLMAADLPLPTAVFAHGWWTFGKEKISKSRGKVINVDELVAIAGSDAARYFLFRETPFGNDGDFSTSALIERYNTELANDFGNLIVRSAVLVGKYFDGKVPKGKSDEIFDCKAVLKKVDGYIEKYELHYALEETWAQVKRINKYINEKEPWKISDKKKLACVVYTVVDGIRLVCILLNAFIPASCATIREQYHLPDENFKEFRWNVLKAGTVIEKGAILFPRKETDALPEFPLNLVSGKVKSVRAHPNADKLFLLTVDAGREVQLVAGIKQWYSEEELVGKKVVVVSNLKPAKLRGEVSNGMLLTAEKDDKVILLSSDLDVGKSVTVSGYENSSRIIEFKDFLKVKLLVKGKKIYFNGKSLDSVSVDIADGAVVR